MNDIAQAPERIPDGRLSVGHTPERIGALEAHYYVIACPHGSTELHRSEPSTDGAAFGLMLMEHRGRTECGCAP